MKHLFFSLLALAMLVACSKTTDNSNQNNSMKQEINEVAGRKNFGVQHSLVTTPQPCVMIATWDKKRTPM